MAKIQINLKKKIGDERTTNNDLKKYLFPIFVYFYRFYSWGYCWFIRNGIKCVIFV